MPRFITGVTLFIFLFVGYIVAQERATFTVGTATAARGQKATGVIAVPSGSDAATNIPVAVFHGARPGPALALVSGAHGTEYASIIALEKLMGCSIRRSLAVQSLSSRWSISRHLNKKLRTSIRWTAKT